MSTETTDRTPKTYTEACEALVESTRMSVETFTRTAAESARGLDDVAKALHRLVGALLTPRERAQCRLARRTEAARRDARQRRAVARAESHRRGYPSTSGWWK